MKIKTKLSLLIGMFFLAFMDLSYAQGIQSLDQATDIVDEVFVWIKGFVIAIAAVNFMYVLIMALIDRKTWNDVFMALVYGLIAGAAAQVIQWGVQYFFS